MIIVVIGPIPERLETDRDGTKHNTEPISASPTMDAQRLEAIEQYTGKLKLSFDHIAYQLNRLEDRVTKDENNYGRAIAMNEDRIDQLEEDIDSLDRRLCRLESPPKTELFNNGRVI